MIKYNNKSFENYIDLLMYFMYEIGDLSPKHEKFFPHSNFFFAKAALEDKFKRPFTMEEIMKLIKQELALKAITLHDEKGASQRNVSC